MVYAPELYGRNVVRKFSTNKLMKIKQIYAKIGTPFRAETMTQQRVGISSFSI